MSKVSVALAGIGITIAIVLVGWIIISATTAMVGTNNAGMQNLTASLDSSSSIYGLGGMIVMIAVILGIIVGLAYFVSSEKRYNKLGKVAEFLIDSIYYFAFGLLAITIIVVPGYLIYLLYNYAILDGQGGSILETLKWVGILVGAFFAISGIGYIFKKKIVDKYLKIKNTHIESKKDKKITKA